jgi:hypothetical protein
VWFFKKLTTQYSYCRIAYKSEITDFKGNGEWQYIFHEKILNECVLRCNKKYPDIKHWIERK